MSTEVSNAEADKAVYAEGTIDPLRWIRVGDEKRQGEVERLTRYPLPPAAVVQFLERASVTSDTPGGSLIAPDCAIVNGMPLLVEAGSARVEPLTGTDVTRVTLTLFARRVTIAAEGDLGG